MPTVERPQSRSRGPQVRLPARPSPRVRAHVRGCLLRRVARRQAQRTSPASAARHDRGHARRQQGVPGGHAEGCAALGRGCRNLRGGRPADGTGLSARSAARPAGDVVLPWRRLRARRSRHARFDLSSAGAQREARRRLGGLPARTGDAFSRPGRGLPRGAGLDRDSGRQPRCRCHAAHGLRRQRRCEPGTRERAARARPRTRRSPRGIAVSDGRSGVRHRVDARVRQGLPVVPCRRAVVLEPVPGESGGRQQPARVAVAGRPGRHAADVGRPRPSTIHCATKVWRCDARLRAAGVPVVSRQYAGMVHGFAGLAQITPAAVRAIEDLAADIEAACRSPRASV